ncbi:MAG: tetratricopeptide (TPR) repeat protein [Saprospiraceae bacterium]|jgi:tetratricopeptide (TPR) repeat protein
MKHIKFSLFLLFFSGQLFAFENNPSVFQSANEAYQTGDFNTAVKQYEQLLQEDYQCADLHYNLANAYFRLNQVGNAVLHYEKAALLNPGDEDVLYNLKVVQKALPDQFDVIPDFFVTRWWRESQKIASPGGWGILGLLILWSGIAGLILWLRGRNRKIRKQGFIAGVILLLISILPFSLGFSVAKNLKDSKRAVIMVRQINLKSAPDEVSENLLELHEGTSLWILDEIGAWKKIRLSNGEKGWLETKVLAKI